jgi:hypothetical protein
LKLTDVINGVRVSDLSSGEKIVLEEGTRINRTGSDFTCFDFRRYGQNWFRQQIYKLRKRGLMVRTVDSRPCSYRIKGENTGTERKDITLEGMGVGANMQQILNESSKQLPFLHDIKIKFLSTQLHRNAVKLGEIPHKDNKGIFEKDVHINRFITATIAIYPKSVSIDISSTYYPLIYDIRGAQELLEHITVISILLRSKYKARDIPDPLDWIATHYHLNQDGLTDLSDTEFHRTISDLTGGFIRMYAKKFPDGTHRMRSERIFTPNITIKEQINDMKNVGNYLHPNDGDISNIIPSQILALNQFAHIVAKISSMYNPTSNGVTFI